LGSGIAPLRKILDAGITVGLGTDNIGANDGNNMFETMKVAALLHKVAGGDYQQWIGAREAIHMATSGGARCCSMQEELGRISVGMKADMVLLNLNKLPFFPNNNLLHQLVFCEQGRSVESVIIDGKIIIEKGRLTTVNEEKIMDELMEREKEIQDKIRKAAGRGRELEPYLRDAYFKCVEKDVGFSRYSY